MHISLVHIKDFRIFEDLELTFAPGLNLIVGENNSGKTALIDAIRYALDTNSAEWVKVQESDFRRGQSRFSIQLKFESITARQARVFVEHLTHESTVGKLGRRSVLRPIEPLLLDESVSEIMGNPDSTWCYERDGVLSRDASIEFDAAPADWPRSRSQQTR